MMSKRGGGDGSGGSGGKSPSPGDPQRVGNLIGHFLGQHGLDQEVDRQRAVEDWPEVVGPKIAAVTEARAVSQGTLFVAVRSSAWLMELNMMKHDILARLNEGREAPAQVERIVFVQGEGGQGGGVGSGPPPGGG